MDGQEIPWNKISVIPTAIMRVLEDGERHTRDELVEKSKSVSKTAIKIHISKLRKLLPTSITIICELHSGGIFYRLIRVYKPISK